MTQVNKFLDIGLEVFLHEYPGLVIVPGKEPGIVLQGDFKFGARGFDGFEVEESYHIQIHIPSEFPRSIPDVKELGGKIPRNGDFHINPGSDTLCLGSPLRLLREIAENPSLSGFAKRCLVPYFFAVTRKIRTGSDFVFGELQHGEKGIVEEEGAYFGVKDRAQVRLIFELLAIKKRKANKLPCPCGCGLRLGKCRLHFKVNHCRKLADRKWFRKMRASIFL